MVVLNWIGIGLIAVGGWFVVVSMLRSIGPSLAWMSGHIDFRTNLSLQLAFIFWMIIGGAIAVGGLWLAALGH